MDNTLFDKYEVVFKKPLTVWHCILQSQRNKTGNTTAFLQYHSVGLNTEPDHRRNLYKPNKDVLHRIWEFSVCQQHFDPYDFVIVIKLKYTLMFTFSMLTGKWLLVNMWGSCCKWHASVCVKVLLWSKIWPSYVTNLKYPSNAFVHSEPVISGMKSMFPFDPYSSITYTY